MIAEMSKSADERMSKCIDSLHNELSKIRTGRAHTGLLDQIKVDYYGNATPLSQVASIAIEGPRTLAVTPWEKNMVQAIEKAILNSALGLNPATAGTVIRVPLPALTEERRKDLMRVVKDEGEKARVAIRNIRRDLNNSVKERLKKKEISEDEERQAESDIQKVTDKMIAQVDQIITTKEKDVMEI